MAYGDYYQTVQKVYLAYYGREADLDGLAYWSARLEQASGNLDGIIEAFANSAEAERRYGDRSDTEKISVIYQSLFDRDPDPGGLQFYRDQLERGEMTQATIMLDILNGAQDQDLKAINDFVQNAMGSMDTVRLNDQAQDYLERLRAEADLPDTLRLINGGHYDVIAGSAGNEAFTHTSGNKLYLGLGGDDTFTMDPYASGRAIFIGGEGDDVYNLTDAGVQVVMDMGGGNDTLNHLAAGSAIGVNYTVDNRFFVSDLYTSGGYYYASALLGDLNLPADRIETINLVGLLTEPLNQAQAVDIFPQLPNWRGDYDPAELGLTGVYQDLASITALYDQYA
jgi:hypothetical protein